MVLTDKGAGEHGKCKVRLDRYSMGAYQHGSAFKRVLWYVVSICFFRSAIPWPYVFKAFLLRRFGARVGKGLLVKPSVNIKYPWCLVTGNHVWIGEGTWIDNLVDVLIGNNVCISQGVHILTGNHDYKKPSFDLRVSEVVLEDGVWVGAGCLVCPGAVMRSHAVLLAGGVIFKEAMPYTVYNGNPAAPVRDRDIRPEDQR